ncbi:uncharacterized protein BDR25DRAFT_330305 [Lindgomyces ingoldianus]|uniref:Uncharacterized protein n=1 Tax=Lindgomyces ingoldianus TaxID=673940 RepID=A0ACB6RE65_9PLEO|nr:uncharacterized protein BDR25DRAFT_330305 [Lindgomyces ingoldianus]KAF2477568.1 hypothetical protein BDR25DRAFT_330305 [Lindgomyces ingoldianus]
MAASAKSLTTLLAQTSLEDHDEILKAANVAIKKSKTDLDAHHVKAVALLKLERYDDAVKLFEDTPRLQDKARFEYAYALYRSGYAARAVDVAGSQNTDRGTKHVLGQAAYRAENFEQAAEVYRQLSIQFVQAEEYDIRINSGAVDAQLEWSGQGHLAQKKKPTREDLDVFETAYNAACGSISRGEFAQGEVCLKRAKDLCNALSDLSEAEKEAEILPITVQQVYLLVQMGRVDEAEQLCTTIPFAEIKELSTRYIAQVNSIATSNEHTNPYLSHRLFHLSPNPPKTDQHFSFQSNILRQDEYVMDLLSQKVAGVANSTFKTISGSPAPATSPAVNTAAVLNAAAHSRNASEKAALKEILPLLEKRPNDVGLLLTITNLYILTNNYAAATHLLESFFRRLEQSGTVSDLDVRHAPGLVATLVSLYAYQGRHAHSKTELAKAASYWRHKSKTPSKPLMTAAGRALLESHDPESLSTAGKIFESLYEQDASDKAAIAGLVAAYSITDPSKLPTQLVGSLPEASRLVSDIDAAALENAGVPTLSTPTQPEGRKRPAENLAPEKVKILAPKKAKKIRKRCMPKDFDPNKKLDPERWLPMRDRSYYRPKGKKGKRKMEGLTQGGPVVEEKVGESKAGGGSAAGQKKKKGKGKGGKW